MILDLFAGPGGWDEGARMLGITDTLGLEWDAAACATAEAAGHRRVLGDLAMARTDAHGPYEGLIASPPCQAWSTAGKGLGKLDKPRIMAHVQRICDAGRWLNYSREGWHDDRSPLVLEPLRYALEGRPEWIACEQVPAVLPLWEAFADILRDHGWHVATGTVSAERYGVPQTRKRAILLARRSGPITLPAPTHQPYRKGKAPTETHLPRWVSMAEALGWGGAPTVLRVNRQANTAHRGLDEPAPTIKGGHDSSDRVWAQFGNQANSAVRSTDEPAATLRYSAKASAVSWLKRNSGPGASRDPRSVEEPSYTIRAAGSGSHPSGVQWIHEAPATTDAGDPRIAPRGHHDRQFNGETVRVSVEEAARLQSFRLDYPWNGGPKDSATKKYEQIGNAIPPVLAAGMLGHLLGIPWHHIAHSMRPQSIVEEFPWLDAA